MRENGRALVGPHTVRVTGSVTVEGHRYSRTSDGELIDASAISVLGPSTVRVRSRGEPDPEMRGYARTVRDRASGRGDTIASR